MCNYKYDNLSIIILSLILWTSNLQNQKKTSEMK